MQSGIGEATFREIWTLLRAFPNPLEAAVHGKVSPRRGTKGWKVVTDTLRLLIAEGKENVSRLIKIIMESPYREYLSGKYPDDYLERGLGIERMAAYGSRFSSLQEFLESLLLEETLFLENVKEENPENDYLTLSTIHSAKGKEWKTVFLIGLNEGRFPSSLGMENIDEERRLFYVAVTRAKDRLFLTCAEDDFRGWGNYTGGPSIFLKELPLNCYECSELMGEGYF